MSNISSVFFLEEEKRKDTIEIGKDMLGFLKIFLQGILYVVFLPLILAILAIYCVYCIFVFIYIAIRSVITFFTGGTPLGDLPEEVEAKRILMERAQAKQENPTQALADALVQSQLQIAQSLYAQQNQQQFNQQTNDSEFDEDDDIKVEDFNDDQSN